MAVLGIHQQLRFIVRPPKPKRDKPGVQQAGVVRVLDVLLHQLPVAWDALAVIAQKCELAAIKHPVKVAADGGAEVLFKRRHIVVKAGEYCAAARRNFQLGQAVGFEVKVSRHAADGAAILLQTTPERHALQIALEVVIPLVVRAHQLGFVALALPAKRHAPVSATVFHHVDAAVFVADQNDGAFANLGAFEVP